MTILLKIIRLWNFESFVKTHTTKIVKDPNIASNGEILRPMRDSKRFFSQNNQQSDIQLCLRNG